MSAPPNSRIEKNMFSKIFKKSQTPAEANPASAHTMVAKAAAWEDMLKAAAGNDTELLALAIDAPSVNQRLSAVQSLASEEGLKAAEREFRKRDRRVHSLAKQRYETLVKQREARASVVELTRTAAALIEAPMIPANRVAELKQAWELLDPALIEDEEGSKFAKLLTSLAELMRERGERKRVVSRWATAAGQALEELSLARAGVAATGMGLQELVAMSAAAREKAEATLAEMPATTPSPMPTDDTVTVLHATIQSALQDASLIEARLAILGELQACHAPQQVALDDEKPLPSPAAIKAVAIERWKGLPPLADQRTEKALNARFDECLHLQDEARKKQKQQNSLIASGKNKEARHTNLQALKAAAEATETALAAGQLAEASKQLAILQAASSKDGISGELQTRIGTLQSEFLRLKDWQHWGGGRARDNLVLEAETLAASTVSPEGSPPAKLPIKQLENSIEHLRARWKELDRLGGATSKPLWQRFDEALKTAYLPVAAHLAKLKEARQENLDARKNLLGTLEALNISVDAQNAPDWKDIQRALAHFQTEWRKLGPVEHTVPHKSQPALLDRMKACIARLEDPLEKVQISAQAEREQLIVRARALAQDVQGRDMMAKLRELQSQWQSHAKTLPLPRKIESKLWSEFRAVTDALMSQREAAFSAREAEFKANQATREALITRLEALHQDSQPAEIKRVLASVDAEWRNAGEAPRNQAADLESRYRAARARVREHLEGSARRSWQLACDALLAKLTLCEELESTTPSGDIEARWNSLPALPPHWEQALQARYKAGGERPVDCGPDSGNLANSGELDQLLLQLESSLEIPSPTEFQKARQTLKLLAMKKAMEGRQPASSSSSDMERMAVAAFRYTHLSPGQRSRLRSIITALGNWRAR